MLYKYIYTIYGIIYHQYTPVMLPYITYMDPMGYYKLVYNFRLPKNPLRIAERRPSK